MSLLPGYSKKIYPPYFRYASAYGLLFSLAAIFAFWPRYLRILPQGGISLAYHIHAITMAAWLAILVVQPYLVLSRKVLWHRWIGRASYFLLPLLLITPFVVLYIQLQRLDVAQVRIDSQLFFINPATVMIFAAAYGLAVANRRRPAAHGFYMLCTSLAFFDPTLSRLYAWYLYADIEWLSYPNRSQWVNFALADTILLAAILFSADRPAIRSAAVKMLAICLAVQISYLSFATTEAWVSMLLWFRTLRLSLPAC